MPPKRRCSHESYVIKWMISMNHSICFNRRVSSRSIPLVVPVGIVAVNELGILSYHSPNLKVKMIPVGRRPVLAICNQRVALSECANIERLRSLLKRRSQFGFSQLNGHKYVCATFYP